MQDGERITGVIKKTIVRMVESVLLESHENQAYMTSNELLDILDIFLSIMDLPKAVGFEGLSGFSAAIAVEFSPDSSFVEAMQHFRTFAHLEPIIKHLLYYILPEHEWERVRNENKTLAWCLARLQLIPPGNHPNAINLQALTTNNISSVRIEGFPFLEQVLRSYIFRNDDSHNCPEITRATLGIIETSLWITYLYITKKYQNALQRRITSNKLGSFDYQDYCRKYIEEYDRASQRRGFVFINFTWQNAKDRSLCRIEDFLKAGYSHILLYGEAGAGKSVSLERIAYILAKEYIANKQNPIPVLIPMCEIDSFSITEEVCRRLFISEQQCEYLMTNKHIVLLLDGLNEIVSHTNSISSLQKRARIIEAICNVFQKFPQIQVYMSDRYITNFRFDQKLELFELKPIDRTDILSFLKVYLVDHSSFDEKSLSLASVSFLNTPLKLKMLVDIINGKTGSIPEDTDELVERYIRVVVEREIYEKCSVDIEDANAFIHLLKCFSKFMVENDNVDVTYKQAIDIFANALGELYLDKSMAIQCLKVAVELRIISSSANGFYNFANEHYRSSLYSSLLFDELSM